MAKLSVLFFTNCEHGQANVALATAYELLRSNEVDVHIASYGVLETRVTELEVEGRRATFHLLSGKSMYEDLKIIYSGSRPNEVGCHSPGVIGATRSYRKLDNFLASSDGPQYMSTVEGCRDLIRTVNPTLVIVDPVFNVGLDACIMDGKKYVILTPCAAKDVLATQQPRLAMFWKYPVEEHGIGTKLPILESFRPEVQYLCPALPELDFDLPYKPSNVTWCGPIVLASPPVSRSDPELAAWLKRGPTVLVVLGSHVFTSSDHARELAIGLRVVLDHDPTLQVLWKLRPLGNVDQTLNDILGKELASGRVRVESWLIPDPMAIMQSGQVVCSVHHGGANSWFEAAKCGVPSVVMPVWYDTYDYAVRSEYLGSGVYGSKTAAPYAEGTEFGHALMAVLGDGPGPKAIRNRARELGDVCQRSEGREVACMKILEMVHAEASA